MIRTSKRSFAPRSVEAAEGAIFSVYVNPQTSTVIATVTGENPAGFLLLPRYSNVARSVAETGARLAQAALSGKITRGQ